MIKKIQMTRRTAMRPLIAAAASMIGFPAMAQGYPNRPIKMIFPAAPGSSSDLLGRHLANVVEGVAGVPVVPDNRAGANGVIGIQALMNAPADGYSLVFTTMSTMAVNKALIKGLPYDPMTDFIPISLGYRAWLYVVVNAKLPYNSITDFIAAAKREPGKFNFGFGTATPQMAGKLLEQRTGAQFTFIPYKSHPMMMQSLVAGEVDLTIVDPLAFNGFVKAGHMKLLGVASPSRTSWYPDVPTLKEGGVPNYELSGANFVAVRAGTPPEAVAKLTQWFSAASSSTSLRTFLDTSNFDTFNISGAEASRYLAGEVERWGSIARAAGIQPS